MTKPLLAILLLLPLGVGSIARADQDICPADYSFRDYMEAVQKRRAERGCGTINRASFASDSSFEAAQKRQGCAISEYCADQSKTLSFKAPPTKRLATDTDEPEGQSLLSQYFASPDSKLYVSCPSQDFAVWGEQDIYRAYRSMSLKTTQGVLGIPKHCSIRFINDEEFKLNNVSWVDPSARYRQSTGAAVLLNCEHGFKVFAKSFESGETALQMAVTKARKQGLRNCNAGSDLQPRLNQMLAKQPKTYKKTTRPRKGPDPSSMLACEQYSQLVYNHIMGNRTPPPMRQVVVINQRRPTEYEGEITGCGMFSCTVQL